MERLAFYLVDVFASEPLTGNPLAVVADADELSDHVMRRIAREFNQSETTFLMQPDRPDAHWRLRSFTPAGVEVAGAGHNALGAWWWLAVSGRLGLSDAGGEFAQQIGDEVLPVSVIARDGIVTSIAMRQAPPTFGRVHPDIAALARALGLEAEHLVADQLIAQTVSTGASHLLVPARDREVVDRARPDTERLTVELRAVEGEGCYLFCLDPVDETSTAYARFFNPTVGIWEDPATGTAAGPLACQLVAAGIVVGPDVVVEQGHVLGRPSRLHVRVDDEVTIYGAAVVAAEGVLRVPAPKAS